MIAHKNKNLINKYHDSYIPSVPTIIILSVGIFNSLYRAFLTDVEFFSDNLGLYKILIKELNSQVRILLLSIISEIAYKCNLKFISYMTIIPSIITSIVAILLVLIKNRNNQKILSKIIISNIPLKLPSKLQSLVDNKFYDCINEFKNSY